MDIVEVEKHFKTCKSRINNLGYRENYKNQEKLAYLDEIMDNIYDSQEKIVKGSLISQREFMEFANSSASPFQKITQQHTIDTSTENVPRRRVFKVNPEAAIENIRPLNKRIPIEEPIRLQEGGSKEKY